MNYGHMKQARVEEKRIPFLKSNLLKFAKNTPHVPVHEYDEVL